MATDNITRWVIRIARETGIPEKSVHAAAVLLEEGGTIPFIARYRKERTGGLDEVQIGTIRDRLTQLQELDRRQGYRGPLANLPTAEERAAITLAACAGATAGRGTTTPTTGAPVVGPPRGTVMVVGGGGQGPELYDAFISAAGGPEALIVDIPTAGGDTVYPPNWRGANGLKTAGAKNVVIIERISIVKRHTKPRQTTSRGDRMPKIQQGGILDIAMPLDASKVMIVCPKFCEPRFR